MGDRNLGERTRSEYRRSLVGLDDGTGTSFAWRRVVDGDRAMLADLLLDGYRGTIDDEGEGPDDARDAIDHMLGISLRDHSIVVPHPDKFGLIAFCSVVVVGELHYVDPIVVAAAHKGRGLGRQVVSVVLDLLRSGGIEEVGAVITDGNVASERLFATLGFTRYGRWG